ncbi:hypothetical protein [Rhizobium oryzicola]|uniref:Anti-sigma factor n=1 Tax=Rhizobium oryzicola TaxID=1232668 RepID=A0ABT8SSI8_9HYPH|nr:hypothetical protein [Rhizobium oryzicola]MDO1581383.1 hypothetical protein [Rhizobium oryzicola]
MRENGKNTMTVDAFRALLDAYGANARRWPAEQRDAAAAFQATEAGQALAAEAAKLDALLARYQPPGPSSALTGRILESAGRRVTLRRRLQRWFVGAGLIGVGLAGGLTGALVVAVVMPPHAPTMTETATAFGNIMTEREIAREIQ